MTQRTYKKILQERLEDLKTINFSTKTKNWLYLVFYSNLLLADRFLMS